MTIGEKIRDKRIELGLSQDELAKRIGYKSRSSINKIELARDLPLSKVEKMAKALNTTPSYLMGWEDEPEPEQYYIDEETKEIAQQIANNKELALLFDATKDAKAEDLLTTRDMLLALKRKERGENEDN